jgi:MFS family permease
MVEKRVVPVSMVMFAGGIAFSGILSFTNAYTKEIGLTEASSLFFLVYAAGLFASRPLAGKLYDRRGENVVLYPAIAFFGVCYVLLAVARGGFVLLLAAVCLAFGYGTLMSVLQNVVVRLAEPQRMGMAISTFYICLDVGTGLGGYLIGWLIGTFGFRSMYGLVACLLFAMLPVYFGVHGRRVGRGRLG